MFIVGKITTKLFCLAVCRDYLLQTFVKMYVVAEKNFAWGGCIFNDLSAIKINVSIVQLADYQYDACLADYTAGKQYSCHQLTQLSNVKHSYLAMFTVYNLCHRVGKYIWCFFNFACGCLPSL
jgi:hypothetical protein